MKIKSEENYLLCGNNGMLNKPGFHSTASFAYKIECGVEKELTKSSWFENDAYFDLAGCTGNISLVFDINSDEGFRNSIYKIETLKSALHDFEKELIDARTIYLFVEKKKSLIKDKDEDSGTVL